MSFLIEWPFRVFVGCNLSFDFNIMDIVNTIIAIGGFGFGIYQFIQQNRKNRESTKEQNEKNWYLSVLVIPQMERINVFFETIVEKIKSLNNNQNNHDLLRLAEEQTTIKESVEAFFSPLEAAMKSFDSELSENISTIEQDLQDEIVNIVDKRCSNSADIERRIMEYKGNLISALYHPIKNNT